MLSILEAILNANPERAMDNLPRRIWKLLEELGEVSEAYLNVTSAVNGKGKTWDDVREEIADVLIVATDIALTPMLPAIRQDSGVLLNGLDWSLLGLERQPYEKIDDVIFEITRCLCSVRRFYFGGNYHEAAEWAMAMALAAVDLAMSAMPDDLDTAYEDAVENLRNEVMRKLDKWTRARQRRSDVTEFVA